MVTALIEIPLLSAQKHEWFRKNEGNTPSSPPGLDKCPYICYI